jgi:hypothetical protein
VFERAYTHFGNGIPVPVRYVVEAAALTCNNTKIPPKTTARAFAPFLTKTPAQIPHTVPNVSSYTLTADSGGGGRGARSPGVPNAAVDWGCEEVPVVAPASSFPGGSQPGDSFMTRNKERLTLAVQFPEVCIERESETCTGKASTHSSYHSTSRRYMVTQVPGVKRG